MIVQVHHNNGTLPELCIMEFQGELIGEYTGTLGVITIKNGDKVEMVIGNHLLEGNFHNMKSPLLVIDDRADSLGDSDINTDNSFSSTMSDSKGLHVQGIVRRKIIFKTRPKPAGKRSREQAELL